MKLNKTDIAGLILILLMFVTSIYLYPGIPDKIPIHWNAAGEIDGYGSKGLGLFLLPSIIAGVFGLFILIPKMAVFKKNIESFMKYFNGMKIVFILFFVGMYIATTVQIYRPFNISYFIGPALGAMLFYVGWIMQFVKRNYFIGIRTPWTLSSDKVWDKTHKLGSLLFRIVAVIMAVSFLFPKYFIWIFLIPLLAMIIWLFVYSYLEFKKEKV
ncbi:MAG: DUF1648 domain-containing protein [Nanoarchaeota archaeon]